MQFSSIQPIDGVLPGTTTPGQSGPGRDGNEGVLCIPQSSSITRTSSWDCLVSYPGHSLEVGSHPSAEVHSVYSTAPADRASFAQSVIYSGPNVSLQQITIKIKTTVRKITDTSNLISKIQTDIINLQWICKLHY